MCRLKSDLRKIGIVTVSVLLFLILTMIIPATVASAHKSALGFTGPMKSMVEVTPTEDPTVTALNKEKLQHENDWWWNFSATILTSVISTLALVLAGIFTIIRYFNDRKDAREKRSEEQVRWKGERGEERRKQDEGRFQTVVAGLGNKDMEAKVGAAIMLRTFLQEGYEQFYAQTFDLAVANLRLLRNPDPSNEQALPLTILSQALIVAFKEALPRARDHGKRSPQSLDAADICLDYAYLQGADLKQIWMPHAYLRKADLRGTKLNSANLNEADLRGAVLLLTDFSGAKLIGANLFRTNLLNVIFNGGSLLMNANLQETTLVGANLQEVDYNGPKNLNTEGG